MREPDHRLDQAKVDLYRMLLALEPDEMTDGEVQILLALSDDQAIQKRLKA